MDEYEDVYVDEYENVYDDDDNVVVVMVRKMRMNARKNLRAKINDNDDKMITKMPLGTKYSTWYKNNIALRRCIFDFNKQKMQIGTRENIQMVIGLKRKIQNQSIRKRV